MRWSLAGGSVSGHWGFTARLYFLFTPCFPSIDAVWAHSLPAFSARTENILGTVSRKSLSHILCFCQGLWTWVEPVQVETEDGNQRCGCAPTTQNSPGQITFPSKPPREMVPSSCRMSVAAAWGAGGGLPCWIFVADLVLGLSNPLLVSVQTHSFLVASVLLIYVSQ